GDGAVIEEEVNLFARREAGQIGACWIDAPSMHILPASSADLANSRRLARRQHRELDSASGQDFKSSKINGGLRQPHTFRRLSKPVLKIADPPQHLRELVPGIRKGQDHMVIALGDGGTVPGKAPPALLVRLHDARVGFRRFFLHPREQRGSEVEADAGVIVYDLANA